MSKSSRTFGSFTADRNSLFVFPFLAFILFAFSGQTQELDQESLPTSKKLTTSLHSGGEITLLQNVLEGGVNPAIYLSISPYYQITDRWRLGLGADISFGRILNNRSFTAAIRRDFKRSFLFGKVGFNQAFVSKVQVTNLRYRTREFLSFGYTYSIGAFQLSSEFLHRGFLSEWETNEDIISDRINAFGLRLSIGLEL